MTEFEKQKIIYGRILFIYAKHGVVKCYSTEELRPIVAKLEREGWKHMATIDNTARWIEALVNNQRDPRDVLDELRDINYVYRLYDNRELEISYSDRTTAICTMGEGWCPVHGLVCPVRYTTPENYNV